MILKAQLTNLQYHNLTLPNSNKIKRTFVKADWKTFSLSMSCQHKVIKISKLYLSSMKALGTFRPSLWVNLGQMLKIVAIKTFQKIETTSSSLGQFKNQWMKSQSPKNSKVLLKTLEMNLKKSICHFYTAKMCTTRRY